MLISGRGLCTGQKQRQTVLCYKTIHSGLCALLFAINLPQIASFRLGLAAARLGNRAVWALDTYRRLSFHAVFPLQGLGLGTWDLGFRLEPPHRLRKEGPFNLRSMEYGFSVEQRRVLRASQKKVKVNLEEFFY